jgi:lambda repressor-like predicted transcriptional regulator
MVTTKQFPKLILIISKLKQKNLSIAELSRMTGIKRTTLNYYLDILEREGLIQKNRIEKKEAGRPTKIKFNSERYSEMQKEFIKKQQQEKEKLLRHPLTINLLKTIKKKSNPSLKDIKTKINNYGIGSHLNWLISQGLIVNEFKLTSEGEKFLKEHSKEKCKE